MTKDERIASFKYSVLTTCTRKQEH